MKKLSLVVICICVTAIAANLFAGDNDEEIRRLQSRIDALEKANVSRGTNVASTVARAQAIQTEFAVVKGAVDSNTHMISSLNNQMQSLYRDLERRVQSVEDQLRRIQDMLRKDLGSGSSRATSEYLAYQDGVDKMTRSDYLAAAGAFQKFISDYPKSKLAGDAQFQTGECYFFGRDYQQAIKQYQVFIERHPRSKKVPNALVMQGSAFVELGMIEEAKAFFAKVSQDFPKSNAAKRAKVKLQYLETGGSASASSQTASQPSDIAIEYPTETIQQRRERQKSIMQQNSGPAPFTSPTTPPQKKAPEKDRNYMEF